MAGISSPASLPSPSLSQHNNNHNSKPALTVGVWLVLMMQLVRLFQYGAFTNTGTTTGASRLILSTDNGVTMPQQWQQDCAQQQSPSSLLRSSDAAAADNKNSEEKATQAMTSTTPQTSGLLTQELSGIPPTPPHRLAYQPVVAVYGGSITDGGNLANPPKAFRYATLLRDEFFPNAISVDFNGVSASGPELHIKCGIKKADIIISEFTLNEYRPELFQQWYELAEQSAQHVVVLSLWSWTIPPNEANPMWSHAIQTLLNSTATAPSRRKTFSLLPMELLQLWDWRKLVPLYFPRHPFRNETEMQVCLQQATSVHLSQQEAFLKCGKEGNTVGTMHGTEFYHRDLAKYLARHLHQVVFPLLDPATSFATSTTTNGNSNSTEQLPDRQCVGQWGVADAYPNWTTAIVRQEGKFEMTDYQSSTSKRTLRTTDANATITLACPDSHQSARLGYIATNVPTDVADFSVNGLNMSTALPHGRFPHGVHIMEFSQLFQPPLDIVVLGLASERAILQFALLACSREKNVA